jgi:tRNA A37 N6-isopentenylltransferase MiaA
MSDSVIIMGPTAVGKSDVAVLVAERLGGEIVSADSMQIYRGLDIGTAKPPAEQLARVPHHMIDVADPSEDYSVAKYRRAAGEVINAIFERKRVPVIVGGTGLYLHSLLYDMDFGGTKGDAAARAEYERLAAERGAAYVHGLLAERDPEAAAKIHPNNLKRVIRALERVKGTHNLIHSAGDDRIKEASDGIKSTDPVIARSEATKQSIEISASVDRRLRRFAPLAMTEKMFAHNLAYKPFGFDLRRSDLMDPALFLLTRERAELVRRIDARVDAMLRAGLVAETE